MATENISHILSYVAGTDVTNKRFVVAAADNKVNRASEAGSQVLGVCRARYLSDGQPQGIAAGKPCPIGMGGIMIVESGAAVSDNAEVMTDSVGRAVAFADSDGTQYAVGRVMRGSSAADAGEDLSIWFYEAGQSNVPVDLT